VTAARASRARRLLAIASVVAVLPALGGCEAGRHLPPSKSPDAAVGPPGNPPSNSPGNLPRNPIARENERPGSPDWEITSPALDREIEGYASATSVERGDPIDLFVSTADPAYTIEVFRMGWYRGVGARRVAGPLSRPGRLQPTPAPDEVTGLVECDWQDPYRLETRDDATAWPTGIYLARLTASRSARQAYVVFVLRDDARPAPIVFQSSVTTFAAYNNWGGRSLYAFNRPGPPARRVSFDRPYAMSPYGIRLDGAGEFLRRFEYNTLRWLERLGYDVSYVTDVDTDRRADTVAHHRVFLSVGHDEYWSWAMREHVEAARDRGVHLAFLGANACFWQIRLEPDARGVPDRTIVAYKGAAPREDPAAGDSDPLRSRLTTGRWRDAPTSRPEASMVGVMYLADPVDGDVVVADPGHWAFAGTGLGSGARLPGLLGYEVDAMASDGPADAHRLAHSPFTHGGEVLYADTTIRESPGRGLVFATGSMYWNWGLDGYNAPAWHSLRVSEAAQRITRNVLDRMLETPDR